MTIDVDAVESPAASSIHWIRQSLVWALEVLCAGLMVSASVIALTQVYFRYVLNDLLIWPEELARWSFVWLVFLGMALGVARRGHIAINVVNRHFRGQLAAWHDVLVLAVVTATCCALAVHGFDLAGRSSYVSPALEWPLRYLYAAVPVGSVMTVFFVATSEGKVSNFPSGLMAVILGLALFLIVRFGLPLVLDVRTVAATLLSVAFLLLLMGIPVAFALAFGAFAAFAPKGDLMLISISQNMTSALDSFILLAIPFFILAAALMNYGGITHRLVDLATKIVGHHRGGLGHVNVLTNTMMAGVSGSSMADAAAISKVLVPEMAARGYPIPFSCALTSAAGVIANLIPPSLGLIIYGALASASVGALFVAAVVPGLLIAVALSLTVWFMAWRHGYGEGIERASSSERWRAGVAAFPALILPVVIVGGVRFGVFTATEAGAVAVLYAIICGVMLYRELQLTSAIKALREALADTIAVMLIIAAAAPFAWVLVIEQVPQTVARWMGEIATTPAALLLVLNVFLLITGLFLEMIAAMVILVPIFIPLINAAGIHPVHFGVVMVINLVIGALTPPLGMLVFTTARVSGAEVGDVFRAMVPFLIALIAVLIIVTYLPFMTLGLNTILGP